jgi:hypothetical protein
METMICPACKKEVKVKISLYDPVWIYRSVLSKEGK